MHKPKVQYEAMVYLCFSKGLLFIIFFSPPTLGFTKLEGVLCCWRGGGANQGNGRDRSSTATAERTTDEGGAPRVRS